MEKCTFIKVIRTKLTAVDCKHAHLLSTCTVYVTEEAHIQGQVKVRPR